jgi:hypothetical protein
MLFLEIHVKGKIDPNLSDWFQGLTVRSIASNEFRLTSEVADSSAIYGILSSLGNLGLTLVSVSVTEKNDTTDPIHLASARPPERQMLEADRQANISL